MKISNERRRAERLPVVKPCKVFFPAARRFAAGRTCNLSRSGALFTIDGGRPVAAGEVIDLTIAFTRMPVVPADRMVRGRVVRAETFETDRQVVAVEFAQPFEHLAAA